MASVPIFLGDEASAAAYRLAGARTLVPSSEETRAAFDWACSQSDLVLLSAEYASYLDPGELARAQMRERPLVLVVPDVCGHADVPDLARQLRSRLGVEA